jgi:hypothetical protein
MTTKTRPTFTVDLECHVMPLVELCRHATKAAMAVESVNQVAALLPDVKKGLGLAEFELCDTEPHQIHDFVSQTLFVVSELLRHYEAQPVSRGSTH